MTKRFDLLFVINDNIVRDVLSILHAKSDWEKPKLFLRFPFDIPKLLMGQKLPWGEIESKVDDAFLALDREQGVFCYLIARELQAKRIVEFGTSLGISTIYLVYAVRENGGGIVIGSEKLSSKVRKAHENIKEAGLDKFVEIREGDALEKLKNIDSPIDFMLNDGFPPYALPILKLIAQKLRSGAVVITDNVGEFKADYAEYFDYIRNPKNRFCSGVFKLN